MSMMCLLHSLGMRLGMHRPRAETALPPAEVVAELGIDGGDSDEELVELVPVDPAAGYTHMEHSFWSSWTQLLTFKVRDAQCKELGAAAVAECGKGCKAKGRRHERGKKLLGH
eukprot:366551-Chlamydomonas_euryale.AAC.39